MFIRTMWRSSKTSSVHSGLMPTTLDIYTGGSTHIHATETSHFVGATTGLSRSCQGGAVLPDLTCLSFIVRACMPWAPLGLNTPSLCLDIALSPFLWGLPRRLFDPAVMLKGSWLFVSLSRSSLLGIEAVFLCPNDIFLISLGGKKEPMCTRCRRALRRPCFSPCLNVLSSE